MLGLGLGVGKINFFGGGISISANKCVNAANEDAYSITFKNLEIGEAYTYNITDGTNNIDDGFTATDKTEGIVEDLSGFDEGDVFITLTSSEGSVVKKVKKDTVSPAGYSVTLSNPFGFPKISTQAEIEFFDLEIGATVNWSIKDAPQDAVSGSFRATAATATVIANVSSLVDGTLRVFCTLVDPCGNTGSEAVSSPITKDTIVPVGYSVRIVENPINNQNEDNVELLFESLEIGATAFWSITDGVNTISDDFTITDTEESVFVDVSTFNNGTITATLVLVDDAGNQGAPTTNTSDKQVFTPSGYSVEFDAASYDSTTGQNASISISGANIGNDYTLTITSSGGGTPIVYNGTVAESSFAIDEINLTELNTGTGTATYVEEDSFGNIGVDATDTAEFEFAVTIYGRYFDGINDNIVLNTMRSFTGNGWWIKLRVFEIPTAGGAHMINAGTAGELRVTGAGYALRINGSNDTSFTTASYPANSHPPITGAIVDIIIGRNSGGFRYVTINGTTVTGTSSTGDFELSGLFADDALNRRYLEGGLFEYEDSLGNIANEANNWLGWTLNGTTLVESSDGGATWS